MVCRIYFGYVGHFSNIFFVFHDSVANDATLTCIQFIDREAGLCGLYGGQVRPPGDEKVGKMITLFEKTMYERLAVHEAKAKM